MIGGYMGRALLVDLSSGEVAVETLDDQLYQDFVGGYGLGARLVYSRQRPGVDPLGPENHLGFVAGPFSGTDALVGSRCAVVGKSPLTGYWGDANSGGTFGPMLKFAGFDSIFIKGASDRPVCLLVDDGRASLKDAGHLWGKDSVAADRELRDEWGQKAEVACIGPAGEKKSLISCVINTGGRAAARSGLGAVMGAKMLKAVVVRGSRKVPVADPQGLKELRKKYLGDMQGKLFDYFRKFGTCGGVEANVLRGDTPVRNWMGAGMVDFHGAGAISDVNVLKYEVKKHGCYRCPIVCGGWIKVDDDKFPVREPTKKPEYETLAALGAMCLNAKVESVIKASDLCTRYGMDTIEVGAAIAFAMECREKGLLSERDCDGIDLTWGNPDAVVALTEKMGKREGLGDLLADGLRKAASRIGGEAARYAMHVCGQAVAMHDPRLHPGYATAYIGDPTPGRHTMGGSSMYENYGKIRGLEVPDHDKYEYGGKGESHKKYLVAVHALNAVGTCLFVFQTAHVQSIPDFLTAITGHPWSLDDVLQMGERIANIRQAFNIREGFRPSDFTIPGRVIGLPPLAQGPTKGVQVDLDTQVMDVYRAMDWDTVTGAPSRTKLQELGLDDVARDLWG